MKRLELRPCDFATARDFVRLNHRHNKPPAGHKYSIACYDGDRLCGVCMVEHRRFELLTSTMRMSRATKYSSLYPLSRKTLVIYSISTKDLLNPFYPKSNLPLPLNTYRIRIAHPRFSSKPMCTYYLLHVTIPNHLCYHTEPFIHLQFL